MTDRDAQPPHEPTTGDAHPDPQGPDAAAEDTGARLPTFSETQARSLLDQPRGPAFVVPDGVTPLA